MCSQPLFRALLIVLIAAAPAACGSSEAHDRAGAGADLGVASAPAAATASAPATAPAAAPASAPAAAPAAAPEPDVGHWPACHRTGEPCPATGWWESRAGYVNRWLVTGPVVDNRVRRAKDPETLIAAAAKRSRAEPEVRSFDAPIFELEGYGRVSNGRAPAWILRARVHSDTARDAVLKLGVTGEATVWLGAKRVFSEESDEYLLPDHRRVPVALASGWNELTVRLQKDSPHALRFSLRLRNPIGQPIHGLVWDVPAPTTASSTATELCAALDVAFTQHATDRGWRLAATARADGLVAPPGDHTWAIRTASGAEPLVELPLSVARLTDGPAPAIEAELDLARAVPVDGRVPVTLTVDGAPCATRAIYPRPGLRARALALAAEIPRLDGLTAGDRDSLTFHADRVRARLEDNDPHDASLTADLATLDALVAHARAGRRPYEHVAGVITRAYRSRMDGTLQRYVVLVPPSYLARPDDAFPLVVASHGLWYTPEDMARIVVGKPTGPGRTQESGRVGAQWDFPDVGALIVAHDGYGNAGQRPPGEVDAMRVIDEVTRDFRVDPRAVTMTGFSLGGSVGFWVPFHHPDVFAASAPLCGYPNTSEYRSVRSYRKRPWEPRLVSAEDIANYAEGGRYLPLRIVHGALDRPERSEVVVERYRALRYDVDFEVVPDGGHNIWDHAYEDAQLVRWLARQRRPEFARAPSVKSARYRFARAYWLRIDRFERHGAFGALDGNLRGDKVTVSTDNVAAFTVRAAQLGVKAGETLRFVVDRDALPERPLEGDLHFAKRDGAWQVVAAPDVPEGHKRAGVEGPLSDLWYDPFIVVYGTQDPLQTEANRMTAEAIASYSPWITVAPPVRADVDVTEADLRGRGVVLVGNPRSNRWTRTIAPTLPVTWEPGAIVHAGKRYEGDDVAISLIRPSPFDPARAVVVHAGVGAEGTLSARYLPEFVPDWIVYDAGMRAQWGDRILGRRDARDGGFYDGAWNVPGSERP